MMSVSKQSEKPAETTSFSCVGTNWTRLTCCASRRQTAVSPVKRDYFSCLVTDDWVARKSQSKEKKLLPVIALEEKKILVSNPILSNN